MTVTIDELKGVPTFSDLPEDQLIWLHQNGQGKVLEAGEKLFNKGEPVDNLVVLFEGKIQFFFDNEVQRSSGFILEAGAISGLLPYSRLKTTRGMAIALENCKIFTLHRSKFQEMERVSPDLTQKLVSLMTNRVRDFATQQQQTEKMMALGKLSAGLAHELNNPASAIKRTATDLKNRVGNHSHHLINLLKAGVSPAPLSEIIECINNRKEEEPVKLSPLERRDKEDEIIQWLENEGIEDSYELAESFLYARLSIEDLDFIKKQFAEVNIILPYLENLLISEQLIKDIEEASLRITNLINSVKVYSHMDQGLEKQPVDIHEGIDSTLVMLGHKIRDKKIEVIKDFEESLPKINASVTELNQAWTNLIDNAIDAMSERGRLTIVTRKEGNFIKVTIQDNGAGIPHEIQSKIFDPFFTTKDVGKGTGLGLDIVKRIANNHKAEVKVSSQPGKTEFVFCFPAHY